MTVDRHDPQSRCQRSGCGHQRAVHTGRHFGSSWTVCTEATCPCWYFDDGRGDPGPAPVSRPQVDNPVDNLEAADDPDATVMMRAGDADRLTTAGWQRGYVAGWNAALDAEIRLLQAYAPHDYGTRQQLERQRILEQLETLKK